ALHPLSNTSDNWTRCLVSRRALFATIEGASLADSCLLLCAERLKAFGVPRQTAALAIIPDLTDRPPALPSLWAPALAAPSDRPRCASDANSSPAPSPRTGPWPSAPRSPLGRVLSTPALAGR